MNILGKVDIWTLNEAISFAGSKTKKGMVVIMTIPLPESCTDNYETSQIINYVKKLHRVLWQYFLSGGISKMFL
jgi:hypothetical protein